MFELPTAENVEKVVVEEATIEDGKEPLLVYREAAKRPDTLQVVKVTAMFAGLPPGLKAMPLGRQNNLLPRVEIHR